MAHSQLIEEASTSQTVRTRGISHEVTCGCFIEIRRSVTIVTQSDVRALSL